MNKLNALDWIAIVLVIIGGINWGLVGLFQWNLIGAIFGGIPSIARIIYFVVGIGALYLIATASKMGTGTARETR